MKLKQAPIPDLMRASAKRAALPGEEITVDLFCGGGGTSRGFEHGLGREVDVAINHDPEAIQLHKRNHPRTYHYEADVFEVDPLEAASGRAIAGLWLSPDCKDFSRAKGGQPIRNKRIRSLAWIGTEWARMDGRPVDGVPPPRRQRPRVIFLENVREFQEWGPLIHQPATVRAEPAFPGVKCRDFITIPNTYLWQISVPQARRAVRGRRRKVRKIKPVVVHGPKMDANAGDWLRFWKRLGYRAKALMMRDPARKGQTFRRFVRQLERSGYKVEYRVLNAADYGAPTHRRRFFLIARCDGQAIVWPEPTHGPVEKPHVENTTNRECSSQKGYDLDAGSGKVESVTTDELRLFTDGASDGGRTPVSRGRARRGGPRPTGGIGKSLLQPYRTAAECIDWQLPCPSIFGRKKELAHNTKRRIVMGLVRFLFEAIEPYIVQVNHGGGGGSAGSRSMPRCRPLRSGTDSASSRRS